MSLLDYKITDQSVQGVYVQSQPDRLTGTPQQNKAAFDAYPALIRKQFNLLVDALGGTTAAGEIPIQSIEGVTAENVQQALAAIQQNLTAYINKLKATTGAAEVGVSTISGISAGNVQKALEGLRAIQITLDSNIQKLMSANGAATVGVNKISGMQAQNVQNALEELRKAIDDSVSGIIPGGSITENMLADDVKTILLNKIGKPIQIWPNSDLNDYTEPGFYYCGADNEAVTISNCPTTHAFSLFVEKGANADPIQTLKAWKDLSENRAAVYIRSGYPDWGFGWKKYVFAISPQVDPLTLYSGWTAWKACQFFKTQENVVVVSFQVKTESPKSGEINIASLPVGFRPKIASGANGIIGADGSCTVDGKYAGADITVYQDGRITGYNAVGAAQYYTGHIVFEAET